MGKEEVYKTYIARSQELHECFQWKIEGFFHKKMMGTGIQPLIPLK